jgi:hypothetical protein
MCACVSLALQLFYLYVFIRFSTKQKGQMPEGVNDTLIVLIPKNQHPEELKDFRPSTSVM